MRSFRRRLSLSLLLLGHVYTGVSLVLPHSEDPSGDDPDPLRQSHDKRAPTEFVTMYGLYDNTPRVDGPKDAGPKLAPLGVVFMAMTHPAGNAVEAGISPAHAFTTPAAYETQAPAPNVNVAVQPTDSPAAPQETVFTMTAASSSATTTASPPHTGPGPVSLPSSTYQSLVSPSPSAGLSAVRTGPQVAEASHSTSKRLLIFGITIGGILLLTLSLFFILDPRITGALCGCHKFKRIKRKDDQREKVVDEEKVRHRALNHESNGKANTVSWVSVSSLNSDGDSREDMKESSVPVHRGALHAVVELPMNGEGGYQQQHQPSSRFSSYSTEYGSSIRQSTATSFSDRYHCDPEPMNPAHSICAPSGKLSSIMEESTMETEELSNPSLPPTPVRPPRPPTTDSPALTDSVYLACSDQSYVIVVPQPLADTSLQPDQSPLANESILSPAEFLASVAQPNQFDVPSEGDLSGSNDMVRRGSGGSKHSRTQSAPTLRDATCDDITHMDTYTSEVTEVIQHERNRFRASKARYPSGAQSLAGTVPASAAPSPSPSSLSVATANRGSAQPAANRKSNVTLSTMRGSLLTIPGSREDDGGNESDVQQDGIMKKMMKHRRSRSASGWAYPSKAKRGHFRFDE